ncbi:A-agglutinin anchorage subunit-like [Strongylocentrotus purpuratus]|uniref:Apple domain-containing protein n=1 Tax=Strongylocentrotus purpuratus TaxID=7668 RepID=A0A7M7PP87_STRPU|nr:A-agglutinin anchorage subunit-like [Strongylocentrotus purpuratus]
MVDGEHGVTGRSRYGVIAAEFPENSVVVTPVTANQACNSGQGENEGSCYYFSESKLNFVSSKSSCEDLGMHLVYIGSQEEQNFMQNNIPSGESFQTSSVQQTTPGAVTSPEGSTQTTPNQMTSSDTSSSTTQTDNIVTTRGSTQPSSTTGDAISETKSSPVSTTPTSHASSTSTTQQGSTDAASLTSEQATDTIPATTSTHTTQALSSATRPSSSRDRGHTSFKNFRLLASNVALIDAYVLSSYTVSSIMECSQLCLTDVRCSCYTFIACEGLCLLGEECLATSTFAFERRTGAKFYSALLED